MSKEELVDKQAILDFLKTLPDETERKFEVGLTDLVEHNDSKSIRTELLKILSEDSQSESVIYAAFYCLTISYRRTKDITLLENLIKKYESRFEDKHATFSHVYALFLKEKGVGKDVIRIIQKSYTAYTKLKKNAGVVHNFADTVVTAYEQSDSKTKSMIKRDWADRADEAVELAIELDPMYAKYYCTKGRLLAINEKFSEAIESIKRAIDMEDSSETDYVIRLANYQYYLLLVQTNQYSSIMNAQLENHEEMITSAKKEIDEKFRESNVKNLEFLGFFAAIVSFTIGSVQIINNQSFENARNLIVVLFAALLSVFSAFGFILHGFGKKSIPNIIVFIIGIIILFGIVYLF